MQRKNAAEIDQYCWIYAEELAEEIPVYLLHKVVKKISWSVSGWPGEAGFCAPKITPIIQVLDRWSCNNWQGSGSDLPLLV